MPVGGERGGSASLRDAYAQPSDLPRAIAISSLHSARAAVFQFVLSRRFSFFCLFLLLLLFLFLLVFSCVLSFSLLAVWRSANMMGLA